MDSLYTGYYHVNFLSRYSADKHLCDDFSRWLPEWNKYYIDNDDIPVYSARMIFSSKRKPDLAKYILQSDSVYLTDPS